MVCYYPMAARKAALASPETGRHGVTFSGTKALIEGSFLTLPCGVCKGCRIERAAGWAVRCHHEAQMFRAEGRESCFFTLTYADEHLPPDGSASVLVVQAFMKRVRVELAPIRVRFLICAEYGERTKRVHYHGLLFGHAFEADRRPWAERHGFKVYRSEQLERLWPFGHCELGTVTYQSARYVAGYIMKKVIGKDAEAGYLRPHPVTGELCQVEPEFQTMSRMPGLGQSWFEKFRDDVFPSDFIVIDAKRLKVPRYYDGLLPEDELSEVKRGRRLRAMSFDRRERSKERLHVKAVCADSTLGRMRRADGDR